MRIIFAAALAAAAAPASAATITHSYSTSYTAPSFGGQVLSNDVAFFDATLGQLVRVDHRARVSYSASISWDGFGVERGGIAFYGEFRDLVLSDVAEPLGLFLQPPPSECFCYFADAGTAGSRQWSATYDIRKSISRETVEELEIASYVGSGSFKDMIFSSTFLYGEYLASNGMELSYSLGASYDVSYTYHYLPNAVPEPTTWAMLIVGFGGVGATTRRRLKARRAAAGRFQHS